MILFLWIWLLDYGSINDFTYEQMVDEIEQIREDPSRHHGSDLLSRPFYKLPCTKWSYRPPVSS
jgi:hypothetical protein